MEIVFMLLGCLSFGIAGFCLGRLSSIVIQIAFTDAENWKEDE